jgi:transcriptional regulator with XRE-family HTH domain
VENNPQPAAAGQERPDPEVQAGRALRRLRTARGWSQEEVGRRMKAYGYDFHQTMIAKIEAAQRPLRVRELADFAALYGMEVHELIYPPAGSLREVSREIAMLTGHLQAADRDVRNRRQALDKARAAAAAAEEDFRKHEGEAAMLRGRLTYLEAQREKLAEWESGE